jgi:hypothetical protein
VLESVAVLSTCVSTFSAPLQGRFRVALQPLLLAAFSRSKLGWPESGTLRVFSKIRGTSALSAKNNLQSARFSDEVRQFFFVPLIRFSRVKGASSCRRPSAVAGVCADRKSQMMKSSSKAHRTTVEVAGDSGLTENACLEMASYSILRLHVQRQYHHV